MGYWNTVRSIGPLLFERWRALMAVAVGEVLALGAFAAHAVAPNSRWTTMLEALPTEAYVGAGALFIIVGQFLVLHDLRKQRDSFKRVTEYEAAVDELGVFFDRGTKILNLKVLSDQDVWVFNTAFEAWRGDVEGFLAAKFGVRERHLFGNSVTVKHTLPGWNDAHAIGCNQVARKLEILRDTITRHCNQAALWRADIE